MNGERSRRIVYVCLSPTFGMHQYTADLANRMAAAGHEVTLVGTSHLPCDRYSPAVRLVTPLSNRSTGLSGDGLRLDLFWKLCYTIDQVGADLVHVTSPHLWTPWLLQVMARTGIATVHTLHDLDPHLGRRFGGLIRIWNALVIRHTHHLLVHGRSSYDRLLAQGVSPARVTYTPLLHLCFSNATETILAEGLATVPIAHPPRREGCQRANAQRSLRFHPDTSPHPLVGTLDPSHSPPSHLTSSQTVKPFALFFGRLEAYKGVGVLVAAASRLPTGLGRVVVAGPGRLDLAWMGPLPVQLELRNHLIEDAEALDLLQSCNLVVLPYLDATQSAVIAVAYYFGKPVIVTRTGALPEYVDEGVTGWVVPPGDPGALAECLAMAFSDPARLQKMGAAGREWRQRQSRSEAVIIGRMYETLAAVRRADDQSGRN